MVRDKKLQENSYNKLLRRCGCQHGPIFNLNNGSEWFVPNIMAASQTPEPPSDSESIDTNCCCACVNAHRDRLSQEEITEDDMVEEYDGFKCVIDPKSVLYLYGLELDFSDALIGGGFQFQNPNAESSCGCGKSFGV